MLEDVLSENTGISGIRKSRTGYHDTKKVPDLGTFFHVGSNGGSHLSGIIYHLSGIICRMFGSFAPDKV